jgi:hypothetical protein
MIHPCIHCGRSGGLVDWYRYYQDKPEACECVRCHYTDPLVRLGYFPEEEIR